MVIVFIRKVASPGTSSTTTSSKHRMSVEARAKEDYKALSQGKGIMAYVSAVHTVSGVGGSCETGQMTKRRIYLGEAGH